MNNLDNTQEEFTMAFFHALSEALEAHGVNIQTRGYSDFPMVRKAGKPEADGWYFRKAGIDDFSPTQCEAIGHVFPFIYNGQAVYLDSITDFDMDEDRYWEASIIFYPMDATLAQMDRDERDSEYSHSTYFDRCDIEPGSYCTGDYN